MSSQKEKKDDYIHIRINSEIKEKLREKAKDKQISLTKYILERVMTNNNVMTNKKDDSSIKTLIEGIVEFNKIMIHNKDIINFPKGIIPDKLKEAINLCKTI